MIRAAITQAILRALAYGVAIVFGLLCLCLGTLLMTAPTFDLLGVYLFLLIAFGWLTAWCIVRINEPRK